MAVHCVAAEHGGWIKKKEKISWVKLKAFPTNVVRLNNKSECSGDCSLLRSYISVLGCLKVGLREAAYSARGYAERNVSSTVFFDRVDRSSRGTARFVVIVLRNETKAVFDSRLQISEGRGGRLHSYFEAGNCLHVGEDY